MVDSSLFAAVDLGSNSFRLEVGQFVRGHYQRTVYLKETVRQGEGLDLSGEISLAAIERGLSCLDRFAERLQGFSKAQVRCVATQTLREARNRDAFIRAGEKRLGHPIDVISGAEEARLIYRGVEFFLPRDSRRRLVIDIGGRSTELIVGRGNTIQDLDSLPVGSVSWSNQYFGDGKLSANAFSRAKLAARAVFEEALSRFSPARWDLAYGSSGTIGAVADLLRQAGMTQSHVDHDGLLWLQKQLVKAGHIAQIDLKGLKDERRAVIAGGLCVLQAVMEELEILEIEPAEGALRHGVLLELAASALQIGTSGDVRDASVNRLVERFGVNREQVARVESVALHLVELIGDLPDIDGDQIRRDLRWASALHEIGLAIAHSDYHKHGAYVVANAELLGFSARELEQLSSLVLGHSGKLKKVANPLGIFGFAVTLMILRIATIICHARQRPEYKGLRLKFFPETFAAELVMPVGWSAQFPQSHFLLEQEVLAWDRVNWKLILVN